MSRFVAGGITTRREPPVSGALRHVAEACVLPGTHTLDAGEHTLGVKIGGANEEAEKAYMFGLDYLRLEKVTAQD